MSDQQQPDETELPDESELPDTDQLEEPSTEKDPEEAPRSPSDDEGEPSHRAVGIGVVDPETD